MDNKSHTNVTTRQLILQDFGKRTLQVAKKLASVFGTSKKILSLQGGIIRWQQHAKQLL